MQRKCGRGAIVRWSGCIRWCFKMRYWSRCVRAGQLANRAVYVALGVNPDGAKFRLQVLTEPNNCGV